MKKQKQILVIMILITIFISILCTYLSHADISHILTGEITYTDSTPAELSPVNSPEVNFPIYSEGAVLMDSSTGKVLYGKNEDEKLYPASTTKILTAILAIEKCNLTDKITASKTAVMSIPSGYSNAAIQPGEALTVQDLLDLFLIHSANEVGFIFAEHISGSTEDFATLMNQKAAELGCKNTHFTNPSGLHDSEHYSTAYDMALIARYCMKNETFRDVVSKTSCTVEATDKYEERYFKNTNDLIIPSSKYYYEYAIGIKTGFTTQAKNCLISASLKDDLELITVALGAEATEDGRSGRYVDTLNLFEYGFSNYKIQQVATANTAIEEITIENATKDTKNLSLLLKDDIISLAPANLDLNNLNCSVDLNENISAPISEGDILGKVTYNIDGINYSSDLVASHNVEEFNVSLLIAQVALAIVVLFVIVKLFFPKKKRKNSNRGNHHISSNRKNSKNKKLKNYNNFVDSIYKFE